MSCRRPMTRVVAILLAGQLIACTASRRGLISDQSGLEDAAGVRIANLERAARFPWLDDGACAVREASGEWTTLVERCYHALDLSRIRFQDLERHCTVATVNAATVAPMVGMCLLVQPQIAVAAVIVIGTVVVAAAIAAELQKARRPGCDCICLGSGAADGKGIPVSDGPYRPPPGKKITTPAQCDYACTSAGYAMGICKG